MKQHVLSVWVIVVAAVDSWFCLIDRVDLPAVEMNPLAVWVMAAGGVELLVASKCAGTALAVYVASTIRPRWRLLVFCSLAAVQLVVALSYLPRIF